MKKTLYLSIFITGIIIAIIIGVSVIEIPVPSKLINEKYVIEIKWDTFF